MGHPAATLIEITRRDGVEDGKKAPQRTPRRSSETALDFHEAGLISAQTMREFDNLCLTPVKPFTPQAIVRLRRKAHVSQAVFAHHLCVTHNGFSMGAWREDSEWTFAQVALAGAGEGTYGNCLMAVVGSASGIPIMPGCYGGLMSGGFWLGEAVSIPMEALRRDRRRFHGPAMEELQ